MKFWVKAALATVGAVALCVSGPSAAGAVNVAQGNLVTAVPSAATPDINNGIVYSIVQAGSRIVVGGTFTSASSHGSSTTVNRPYMLAFDSKTGTIDPNFAPNLDGMVQDLTPGPSPDTVYAAGYFNNVNGQKAKGVALLSTVTGAMIGGFQPAALNGAVFGVRLSGGHLFIGGTFTKVGGATHNGLATLGPLTGKLDPYLNVQLTGHHNYTGQSGQSNGAVGPRKLDISPDGSRMVVIGNFKNADSQLRNQIAMVDLSGTAATLDPNWATAAYSATCFSWAYDTYMNDIDFSPDGSYFAVGATGGSGTNSDGTNSTCDSVARFETAGTGADVRPTWIDYTGQDTIGSVAVAGDAVYSGGHNRWLNNESGHDNPGQGAVPRPGLAALDPSNGVPFSWNPGRTPRGIGAYALLATQNGLYVGSDTEYIGDYKYLRKRLAFFPLAGGEVVTPPTTPQLPANVYLAGQLPSTAISSGGTGGTNLDTLQYRHYDGSMVGPTTPVSNTNIAWSQTRGAFMVGSRLFYGWADGNLYERSFDGSTFGAATLIDPYDDPTWSNVQTGSGQTYRGTKPGLYGQFPNVTGMFYSAGYLYYTMYGQSTLYARYFTPESGIVGAHVFTTSGDSNVSNATGMFLSGNEVYYASRSDGTLHRVDFANGTLNGASDAVVSGPAKDGNDWRARALFLNSGAPAQNTPPTAVASASCSGLTCAFDGSQSTDSDGQVKAWAWNFGDNSPSVTGSTVTHTYSAGGAYTATLTVTDNDGATGSTTTSVSPAQSQGAAISFVGSASTDGNAVTETVTVPSGVQAGDGMVLVATSSISSAPAGPTGWTLVKAVTNGPSLTTTLWQRVATATDPGSSVAVGRSGYHKASLQLVAYRNTSGTSPVSAAMETSDPTSSNSHTTPVVSGVAAGSWVISYWADKGSGPNTWSAPSGPAVRDTRYGTGSGQISALVADSSGPVGAGSYGGLTATTSPSVPKAEQWTIVLAPGQ